MAVGQKLTKWAIRLSGYYKLSHHTAHVFIVMANMAQDYDARNKDGMRLKPARVFASRTTLAELIEGDPAKGRNLIRPLKELRALNLIESVGVAHRGQAQEYRLCIAEAVTAVNGTGVFTVKYRSDYNELIHMERALKRGDIR